MIKPLTMLNQISFAVGL